MTPARRQRHLHSPLSGAVNPCRECRDRRGLQAVPVIPNPPEPFSFAARPFSPFPPNVEGVQGRGSSAEHSTGFDINPHALARSELLARHCSGRADDAGTAAGADRVQNRLGCLGRGAVGVVVAVGSGESVGTLVGVLVAVAVAVLDGVGVLVRVGVPVGAGVFVAVAVGVADGVGVRVAVGVLVAVTVLVAVGVGGGESVTFQSSPTLSTYCAPAGLPNTETRSLWDRIQDFTSLSEAPAWVER
jgi:hypothetical protein